MVFALTHWCLFSSFSFGSSCLLLDRPFASLFTGPYPWLLISSNCFIFFDLPLMHSDWVKCFAVAVWIVTLCYILNKPRLALWGTWTSFPMYELGFYGSSMVTSLTSPMSPFLLFMTEWVLSRLMHTWVEAWIQNLNICISQSLLP